MKKLTPVLLIITGVASGLCAGRGFTTTFSFPDMEDSTGIIIRIHDSQTGFGDFRFDTIQVINGKAVLADSLAVDYPVQAFAMTPAGFFPFYAANGQYEIISGTQEDIKNLTLSYSGALWSEDAMWYNRNIEGPRLDLSRNPGFSGKLSKERRDSIRNCYDAIDEAERARFMQQPDSWVSLIKVTDYMMDIPRDSLREIYAGLSPEKKASLYGRTLERYLSVSPITIGSSLKDYDIVGKDRHGKAFRLSDMKEPYIVLDFSQCYCGPCIAATKEIARIKDKYGDRVAFVNYAADDTEQDWRKAMTRDSITWSSVYDGTGSNGNVCLKYNVNSYPSFFIFGPDRTLVRTWSGYGPGRIETELSNLK